VSPPLVAPAKLTLTLRVLGTRTDGFHDLEALTVSLDAPVDTLTITRSPDPASTLRVGGPAGEGVPVDGTNLVLRAADRVLPDVVTLDVVLHKEIPSGTGLGGGSSDAAAVLRYCAGEFGLAPEDVEHAAAALGSDVPFCLDGGPAWMRGRGEHLEPVRLPAPVSVVVAIPPFGISTPAVYGAWDELGGPGGRAVAPPPVLAPVVDVLVNDLEPAADHVEPRLAPFRAGLEALAGRPALLAGSGSACWVACADRPEADALATEVRAQLGVVVFAGTSVPRGVG
jgi:4-diphosphocytidyl-2-C-methyl-D-erythritol kinase